MDESQQSTASPAATQGAQQRSSARSASGTQPRSSDEARREIEATRERISDAFDRLGSKLEQKKEELREKADVFRPLREKVREIPLPALGAAFAIGVLAGMVRAGRKRAEPAESERELPLEPGEEAVVDVEQRRIYAHPYAPKHTFLHELRSVLAHQIGNAVVGAIAGLISAKMAQHEEHEQEQRRRPVPPPYGYPF